MYYYTYKTTNVVNGKVYFGMHQTSDLDDGYLGSGNLIKRAIRKYGEHNFTKEILQFFNTCEDMHAAERLLVTENVVNDPNTYNLRVGGIGGFRQINDGSEEHLARAKRGAVLGGQASRDKRVGIFAPGFTWEGREENLARMCDKAHTDEANAKRSATRAMLGCGQGEKNSQYGSKWMTHHEKGVAKVKSSDLEKHLEDGWIFGRK